MRPETSTKVVGGVVDGGQGLGERSTTGRDRGVEVQGIVWALQVVEVTPGVEGTLAVGEVGECATGTVALQRSGSRFDRVFGDGKRSAVVQCPAICAPCAPRAEPCFPPHLAVSGGERMERWCCTAMCPLKSICHSSLGSALGSLGFIDEPMSSSWQAPPHSRAPTGNILAGTGARWCWWTAGTGSSSRAFRSAPNGFARRR